MDGDYNKSFQVRTRFPPSPTGVLHLGGARTALFNWLFARHNDGKFILRLEDTDRKRSDSKYVRSILKAMEWLTLWWDEGPFYQSRRLSHYRDKIEKLVIEGKAYRCHCSAELVQQKREIAIARGDKPQYDGTCRDLNLVSIPGEVIRFRSPHTGTTVFNDLVKGSISFNHNELDDLILMRSDGIPTYHIAVVVDDIDMAITHVIRGDDHINNTPRQILLYQALGKTSPFYAHIPMIIGKDKNKLSKRHGATAVINYREMGYLPEALINALARLGWSYGNQEIFSLAELVKHFSLEAIGKSAAIFDIDRLTYLNHHYLQCVTSERLSTLLLPFLVERNIINFNNNMLLKILPHLITRVSTLKELAYWAEPYLIEEPIIDQTARAKFINLANIQILIEILKIIMQKGVNNKNVLENDFRRLAVILGVKLRVVIQPMRVALTGRTASPGIFEVMSFLGDGLVIRRLKRAIRLANN